MRCSFCGDEMTLALNDRGPLARRIWQCLTCGFRKLGDEEIKKGVIYEE